MNNNDNMFEAIKGVVVIILAIIILACVKNVAAKLILCIAVFVASLLFDKFTGGGNL